MDWQRKELEIRLQNLVGPLRGIAKMSDEALIAQIGIEHRRFEARVNWNAAPLPSPPEPRS